MSPLELVLVILGVLLFMIVTLLLALLFHMYHHNNTFNYYYNHAIAYYYMGHYYVEVNERYNQLQENAQLAQQYAHRYGRLVSGRFQEPAPPPPPPETSWDIAIKFLQPALCVTTSVVVCGFGSYYYYYTAATAKQE